MKKRSNVVVKAGIVLGFLLFSFGVSDAQNSPVFRTPYTTALGIRVGGTSGATIKHFFRPATAVEGILGTFGNGFSITALMEKNARAFDVEGLNWYYGGGAHIAFYNGNRYYNVYGREISRDNHDVGLGINGIIGLEYSLPDNIPVAFSLDLKPFIEISGGDVGVAPDLALGIKFLIR
jgi:hypothetical protein